MIDPARLPRVRTAAGKASVTRSARMWSAIAQPAKRREARSMTVPSQQNFPPSMGRKVMSPTYSMFGTWEVKSRPIKSGVALAAAGSGTVVRYRRRNRNPRSRRPA